jgi:hypothetical protein
MINHLAFREWLYLLDTTLCTYPQHLLACKRIRRTSNHAKLTKHSPVTVTYLKKASIPIQLPRRLASTHAPPPQTGQCQFRCKLPKLIKNGTANGAASNAYLTTSYVPVMIKCIIIKNRTGTLYNQKHAVMV